MATFDVDIGGKTYEVDAPNEATAWKYAKATHIKNEPEKSFTAEMLKNAPSSLYQNTIGGLVQIATSPVQTAKGLGKAVVGGVENLMPGSMQTLGMDPARVKRAQDVANAVGQEFIRPYSSGAEFKQTMQEDPFRVLGDISLLATGGATATGRIPMLANALTKTASITNPINALIKPVTLAGKYVPEAVSSGLGLLTGVGSDTVKTAFKSGLKGTESFKENMRGGVPITQVLDDAKTNLATMNAAKQSDYRSGMVDIANDKTILNFSGIDNALTEAEKFSKFKGKVINETADNLLTSIKKTVDDWKKSDPVDFHTPEGLDQLKQAVWGEIEKLPQGSKQAYTAGKKIYDSIKTEIGNQAPTYAKVMKDYSEASDLVHEIERALSLGQKASADTAIKKLQSLTRNNVTTNYGQRSALAEQLVAQGGNEIMPALAGQAMSTFTPRNLAGQSGAVGAGLGAFSNPAMLAALPFMSPRLVGEAAYGAGNIAKAIGESGAVQNYLSPTIANANRFRAQIPMTAEQAKIAALIAAQAGQTPYRIELNNMASNRP
jgi:hypothetical protein